jgi:hypothetical protein
VIQVDLRPTGRNRSPLRLLGGTITARRSQRDRERFRDQLRFDAALGTYIVNVAPNSVGISKGLGTHYVKLQLDVGVAEGRPGGRPAAVPRSDPLYAPQRSGPHVPLAMANTSVAFKPGG